MLLFISDLHLSDGTLGTALPAGAVTLLAERLVGLAESASWRADDTYVPLERIDLVIVGDGLDLVRSARWLAPGGPRPWDDPQSAEFVDTLGGVVADTLEANGAALEALRAMTVEGSIRIPPANRAGRPAHEARREPVAVRLHYMVGNSDWMLHVPGSAYDHVRQKVAHALGLATAPDAPFPHDPAQDDDLQEVLRRHRVLARHGDVFDPLACERQRAAASLTDVLALELVGRFAGTVRGAWANVLPPATLAGLGQIDTVRPLTVLPRWIDGLLARTCPDAPLVNEIKQTWDGLVGELAAIPFVADPQAWRPRGMAAGLIEALKFQGRGGGEWLATLSPTHLASHALVEADFRNRRARHIVYAHTHLAESVPLEASFAEGYALRQVYFNTGTWRRVHRPTLGGPAGNEFVTSQMLSFLAIYQGEERKGRPYETWTGTLGVETDPPAEYRVDPVGQSHAEPKSVPAPGLSQHRPHFAPSAADRAAPAPTRVD